MGDIERSVATDYHRETVARLTADRDSWRRVAERLEREKVEARDQLKGAVDAGDRLAVMLRASFHEDHYGSPEHETRCREALREWDATRGGR